MYYLNWIKNPKAYLTLHLKLSRSQKYEQKIISESFAKEVKQPQLNMTPLINQYWLRNYSCFLKNKSIIPLKQEVLKIENLN